MMLTCPRCDNLCEDGRVRCICGARLFPSVGDLVAAKPLLTFTCSVCQLDSAEPFCGCCGARLSDLPVAA